ncbi:MAG: SMP-30/gluconolactonase/LRE family protein [Pseudomonadota bacterium]
MKTEVLADGFAFLEGPRWRDGALWMSDMHGDAVYRLTLDGDAEKVMDVPQQPSGLGWLPNGDMLVVSMLDKKLLRRTPSGEFSEHADISALVPKRINDMVVDSQGRAWVGNFGFIFDEGETPVPTVLVRVDPDGSAEVAASDLFFPNGTVVTDGGSTLVVAETYGRKLTAFDIGPDSKLSNRRDWGVLENNEFPDGICLDAEGGIWIASPTTGEAVRMIEGGEITDRIETGRMAIATALGGNDGKTLFVLTSESTSRQPCRELMSARVEFVTVSIPGA